MTDAALWVGDLRERALPAGGEGASPSVTGAVRRRLGASICRHDDEVLAAFAVVEIPGDVGAEVVHNYGYVFDRLTLYMPYDADPELMARVTASVRQTAGIVLEGEA